VFRTRQAQRQPWHIRAASSAGVRLCRENIQCLQITGTAAHLRSFCVAMLLPLILGLSSCGLLETSIISASFAPAYEGLKWYKSATAEKVVAENCTDVLSASFEALHALSIGIESAGKTADGTVLIECRPIFENSIKTSVCVIPLLPEITKIKIISRKNSLSPEEEISNALLAMIDKKLMLARSSRNIQQAEFNHTGGPASSALIVGLQSIEP